MENGRKDVTGRVYGKAPFAIKLTLSVDHFSGIRSDMKALRPVAITEYIG